MGFSINKIKPNKENYVVWLTAVYMTIGLFVFKWNPIVILLAYFIETIVIGCIHLVKMTLTALYSKSNSVPKVVGLIFVPFFFVHFFLFIAVQLFFVLTILDIKGNHTVDHSLFGNYAALLEYPDLKYAYFMIIISNVFYETKRFFLPKKYQYSDSQKLMGEPYSRVIIQQFVAIFSGFILLLYNNAASVAFLLIIMKLFTDLFGIQLTSKDKQ
jgi:hypothetical protein